MIAESRPGGEDTAWLSGGEAVQAEGRRGPRGAEKPGGGGWGYGADLPHWPF